MKTKDREVSPMALSIATSGYDDAWAQLEKVTFEFQCMLDHVAQYHGDQVLSDYMADIEKEILDLRVKHSLPEPSDWCAPERIEGAPA